MYAPRIARYFMSYQHGIERFGESLPRGSVTIWFSYFSLALFRRTTETSTVFSVRWDFKIFWKILSSNVLIGRKYRQPVRKPENHWPRHFTDDMKVVQNPCVGSTAGGKRVGGFAVSEKGWEKIGLAYRGAERGGGGEWGPGVGGIQWFLFPLLQHLTWFSSDQTTNYTLLWVFVNIDLLKHNTGSGKHLHFGDRLQPTLACISGNFQIFSLALYANESDFRCMLINAFFLFLGKLCVSW